MAEQDLKLPELDKTPSEPAKTGTTSEPISTTHENTISTKETIIAFGGVLVASIVFFFIKNAVSKMLVASYKKSPRSADMAGWGLFCVLLFASIIAALAILDSSRFLTLPYLIPLGIAILLSLVMFVIAMLSKR